MGTAYPSLFAALAAPFHPDEIKSRPGKGGVQLKYVTARTVMNRLDEVLGPENWEDMYTETKDGIKCRITIGIECPDGTIRFVFKEDGSGFAKLDDESDTEKSGFSEAFKRCAVKFGVGRYLYRDGMPPYVRAALGITEGRVRPGDER